MSKLLELRGVTKEFSGGTVALDDITLSVDGERPAIIAVAGFINALHLTGRDIETTRLVCNGAGASAIACASSSTADQKNLVEPKSSGVQLIGNASPAHTAPNKSGKKIASVTPIDNPARLMVRPSATASPMKSSDAVATVPFFANVPAVRSRKTITT